MSPVGQKFVGEYLYLHAIRAAAVPPPGGLPISQLLLPEDWHAFLASRPEFIREWDRLTGMR